MPRVSRKSLWRARVWASLGETPPVRGQLLSRWQQAHPDRTLYLAYFGTADAEYYGVHAQPITLGTDFKRITPTFPDRGVVAASVTMLQARWKQESAATFFKSLRDREPDEVLGGSIYLYDLGSER